MAVQPLSITFGIELEFYIRFREGEFGVGPPSSIRAAVRREVRMVLGCAGVPARLAQHGCDDYSQWQVQEDQSLTPYVRSQGYEYVGVELVTRIFSLQQEVEAKAEIRAVFQALHSSFDLLTDIGGGEAGLHIHIGNGPQTSLPLRTAQKLAMICTSLEGVINPLIPPERLYNGYCSTPSQIRQMYNLVSHPARVEAVQQHIQLIANAYDLDSLLRAAQGTREPAGRYAQLNLQPLRTKGTVEFRYFPATTCAELVLTYLSFFVTLTSWAHLCTAEQGRALRVWATTSPTANIFGLLDMLRLTVHRPTFESLWHANAFRHRQEPCTCGGTRPPASTTAGGGRGYRSMALH